MNILNERYQFYCRQQTDRETVEEFIVSLYQLAASCNFDNQEEWLIRDHILFGLSNKNISMKIIQDGGNPTLSEVIEMCASLHGGVYNAAEESNNGVVEDSLADLNFRDEDLMLEFPEIAQIDHDKFECSFQLNEEFAVKNEPLPGCNVTVANETTNILDVEEEPFLELVNNLDESYHDIEYLNDTSEETDLKDSLSTKSVEDDLLTDLFETDEMDEDTKMDHQPKYNRKQLDRTNTDTPKKRVKRVSTKVFNCDQCPYTTNENYLLKLHMYRHTTEKTLPCPICQKLVKNTVHLRAHMRNRHTSSAKVTCELCQKDFKSQYTLNNHILTMHPETSDDHNQGQYKCHICGKVHVAEASLKRHLYQHTREKSFLCNFCGASKRSEKELQRHMLRDDHNIDGTIVKPFKCTYCERRFSTKNQMETHIPVHTGEKAFQCAECGKRFANRNNLHQHKLTHMERRHQCEFCEHKCRSKGNLRKHMQVHTGQSLT